MSQGEPAIFDKYIAEMLKRGKIFFTYQPAIRGTRPDFLVKDPHGTSIILETKSWEPTSENISRAINQAQFYKESTGADYAFVVPKGVKQSNPSKGVVSSKDLIDVLLDTFEKGKKAKKMRTKIPISKTRRKVFAALPFTAKYDDVYLVAMTHAANCVKAVCVRVDKEEYSGDIVKKIKKEIKESIAVIADLSESNPNVLYEVGFAHALKQPIVHICSTSLKKLPFDVSHWNALPYSKGQTHALRTTLAKRLRAVLNYSS